MHSIACIARVMLDTLSLHSSSTVARDHSESSIDHWASGEGEAARASEQLVKLKPLVWHFDAPMLAKIQDAHQKLMKITKAIDIHVLRFEAFGKGLIKRYVLRVVLFAVSRTSTMFL